MRKYKPTSPGRRGMIGTAHSHLSKEKPLKGLLRFLKNRAGRNSRGKLTVRHQGGGHKRRYRLVDFKQNAPGLKGRVEGIEYDPYRSAHIARVLYEDGSRRYVLAAEGMRMGDLVESGEKVELKSGMRTTLERIPAGTFVHNVETAPGRGGGIARSAGVGVQVLGAEGGHAHLKMPSGEVRKVSSQGLATIGKVSNSEHNLQNLGKAGRTRWMRVRPTVRGSVMNAADHPYGGGEGRAQRGTKRPKTKWGKVTGGRKTRKKNKWSNQMILKRRKTKRNK